MFDIFLFLRNARSAFQKRASCPRAYLHLSQHVLQSRTRIAKKQEYILGSLKRLIPPKQCNTLAELRNNIDCLDDALMELLIRRLFYSKRAAELKGHCQPDFERENAILEKAVLLARSSGIPEATIKCIFKAILGASREFQHIG